MSYKTGGTGKGSTLRTGLDKEKYEENMERLRSTPKVEDAVKEVVKEGTKTIYKY